MPKVGTSLHRWGLGLILIVSFLVKVPALRFPLVGYFGSYQTIMAMMGVMMGAHPSAAWSLPKTFQMVDGLPGLHLLYYPLASLVAVVGRECFGGSLDFYGRLQAAVFILAAAVILYAIVRNKWNRRVALWATLIFSFSPMVLVSGMSFRNEAAGLFFLLLSVWFWTKHSPRTFLSGLAFSISVVLRLHFVVLTPMFVCLALQERLFFRRFFPWLLGVTIPSGLWYGYVYLLTFTGLPILTSLFVQLGGDRLLATTLLQEGQFYKQLFNTLSTSFLTPMVLPFLVVGLTLWDRRTLPFILWVILTLGMVILIPQKVQDHPFYLVYGVPACAILAAMALDNFLTHLSRPAVWALLVVFLIVSMRYYIPPAFLATELEKRIPAIGKAVQAATESDALIAASRGSSCDLLYYCDRLGWAFDLRMREPGREPRHEEWIRRGYGDPVAWLEHLREQGCRYLVITERELFDSDSLQEFRRHVTSSYVLRSRPQDVFFLFDLRTPIDG